MRLAIGILCVAVALGLVVLASAPAQEKKDPLEGKRGVTVGKLTGKGKGYIEVLGDGEEKGRKFVPEWVGGNPDKGGGPDKAVLKVFDALTVGSRVEVDWVFHERLRALKI